MSSLIFVYGTLKTNQRRGHQWPLRPIDVQPAWTLGRLLDTGPYPAMIAGDDRVAGQLWNFRTEDLARTFEVLDEIEGTDQPGMPNDYDRIQQAVYVRGQLTPLVASTYRFARLDLVPQFDYIEPHLPCEDELYSIWPRETAWVV